LIELQGKHANALVYTDIIDSASISQIISLLNQPYAKGAKVRMMPDVHAGIGCTVGTTMTVSDKICPNLVGVDIGCGMETVLLKEKHIEPSKLDVVIRDGIPSGFSIRRYEHRFAKDAGIEDLYCAKEVDLNRAMHSVGTLGGGNHFIEVDRDEDGRLYLVIHSGSRHLGAEIAAYYQNAAYEAHKDNAENITGDFIPKDLAYVEGGLFERYIHDMKIAQRFADLNRRAMVDVIIKETGLHTEDAFTTVHNYIDTDRMILRKGAVSALEGERLLIPMNMRDGSLICIGKGNEEWNFSAPHGAGRLVSRGEARERFTLTEYKKEMEGIWSTSVSRSTIDECPMAYKSVDDILVNIEPTVSIERTIKPVYNFKAGRSDD